MGALGENAFEIGPAQVDVLVVEGAVYALDRIAGIGLSLPVGEFKIVDRVAHGAQCLNQADAAGDVPVRAEEIHHIAFGAQARLALDYHRFEAAPLELDGEGQSGDAGPGNQNAFAIHVGRSLLLRPLGNCEATPTVPAIRPLQACAISIRENGHSHDRR